MTAKAATAASEPVNAEAVAGFNEKRFVAEFNELTQAGKSEEALDLLIDILPRMSASRMNRKEKHNHLLYASRLIQNGGNAKHGYQKLLRKVAAADEYVADYGVPPASTFLDFGCGAHDPIAVASYYYLNGFRRAIACDLLPPRNPVYSALSMYDILAHVALFPDKFIRTGMDQGAFRERLLAFRPEEFAGGDFQGGLDQLQGKVDYRVQNLLDLDIADEELGFVVSFAVLEHVDDIAAITRWLFRKSRPGGIQYHFVDMADHRAYSPRSGFDAWTFLTEEAAPRSMNRLRKSEHLHAVTEAGFEVLQVKSSTSEIPEGTARKILPRWKQMSLEDRETVKLHLVLRRPS